MEPLYFQSCEEVDTYFREGRDHFNETYVKKLAQTSTYFSRTSEATWPMNAGTQQKGFRFGRGFYDPTKPWKTITSARCEQDSCDMSPEKIRRPGNDSYFWHLFKKEMLTDWICVEDLMYRLLPVEEIMQFEQSNAIITRDVHEEFSRSSYIGGAGHKWISFVNDDNSYCGEETTDQGWEMDLYSGESEGGYDSRYIYVKCAPADLDTIATLSLDLLDEALIDLGDEDEAFRVDLRERGLSKLDIIVPDARVARKLFLQAKESNGWTNAETEFDMNMSQLKLGLSRIIGDYAFSYDSNAMRYNADTVYNAGLATYDENNRATWARLVRVLRYIEEPAEIGYSWAPNRDYKAADFGITVHWMSNAIQKWRNPQWTGTGQVKMAAQNYSGDFDWRRPDWECNLMQKSGFFVGQFRLGMQIKDPTIMHVFLHRIDRSKNLTTSPCPVQSYTAPDVIETYACQGVQADADRPQQI